MLSAPIAKLQRGRRRRSFPRKKACSEMCEHIKFGDGSMAIICGGRHKTQHCKCGRAATALCDWKMPGNKTCDAPICDAHKLQVAPGKDLCVFHQHAFELWKKKHPDFDIRAGEQRKLFEQA